ncbi:MAG: hypothetical protein F6K22_15960 [Okeania sp. SIO2F4]|uniref:ribosome-inactivating family protein n=1 Tax=Okeania sp. SIO2F4 TaxID=2607790 RepID=UPI0014298B81|nr:ribosome-inactivating family protein [Okeania sp. SIO2F4]NES04197.1 hypothetical protein [Okeania sp. SIO2F4]
MATVSIRFKHGGAYNSDIRSLRDRIRANGTLLNCLEILIIHPQASDAQPSFFINLAFQANPQEPPANASVYTVAFKNQNNVIYRFDINPPPPWQGTCNLKGKNLAQDGSYASLGYPNPPFPEITNNNLKDAVNKVASYNGCQLDSETKRALTRLIIAVNEAIRFREVENGIAHILSQDRSYEPDWDLIHNWGGHTLG